MRAFWFFKGEPVSSAGLKIVKTDDIIGEMPDERALEQVEALSCALGSGAGIDVSLFFMFTPVMLG